jgi:hypothetical protein
MISRSPRLTLGCILQNTHFARGSHMGDGPDCAMHVEYPVLGLLLSATFTFQSSSPGLYGGRRYRAG